MKNNQPTAKLPVLGPRFLIFTLGCKVNQYDSAALEKDLLAAGFTVSPRDPDLVIVNTCSVTKIAITKDRQAVKRLAGRFPKAKIIIMGCWPQTDDQAAAVFPQVVFWGVGQRDGLLRQIKKMFPDFSAKKEPAGLLNPSDHSRYFLKVGDGCNQFCSYCLIPYARGPIKSRPETELLQETAAAIAAGYQEIVLSGIHLGRYGQDLGKDFSLLHLLEKMLALPGLGRLRLSSIEITEVTDELIALMVRERQLCRHLHISLQSGCDRILQAMNRPYDTEYFRQRVKKLRMAMPEIAISTDIIVGFPGETGADFVDTCRFAEEIAFSRIHVFSFSAHEKTAAYNLPDRVPLAKIKQRSQIMRDISQVLERNYLKKIKQLLAGQETAVIIEQIKNGRRIGKTEFYFDLELPAKIKEPVGSLLKVRL